MNNLVVQLLLKTGNFSTDLKQARGQVQNFQKGCQTAGQSVSGFTQALGLNIGQLTKFGGAVGAAVLAGKAFKAIIDGSQTSSDKFEAAQYSCKNAVKEFASAISTFDFTAFNNGLSDMIDRGIKAAQAIDQLGNTIMSYDIKSAKLRAKIAKAKAIIYTPGSTPEEIEEAKKVLADSLNELKDNTTVLLTDYENTIIAEVNARGANLSGEGAMAIIDKWMTIDTTAAREKAKEEAKAGYDAFTDELNKLNSNSNYQKTIVMPTTWGSTTVSVLDRNNPDYQKELKALNDQYKDQVAYHVLLDKFTTDELKNLGAQRIAMINIEAELDTMATTAGKLSTKGGVTGSGKDDVPVLKESLTYWEKILQKAKEHRSGQVFNSQGWNTYNDIMDNAIAKIDEINQKTKVLAMRKAFEASGPLPKLPGIEGKAEVMPDMKTTKYSAEELEHLVKIYTELRDRLKEGDPLIESYNQKIEELQKRLESLRKQGIDVPELKVDTKSFDNLSKIGSSLQGATSGLYTLSEAFDQLIGKEEDADSVFKKFVDTIQIGVNVLQAMASITQAVIALQEVMGATAVASAATKVAAETTAAGATAAAASTEVAANTAVAASGAAASSAAVPVVGPALAVAAVAAVLAAIIAAISSSKKVQRFANGGIVGGSSFTGDRVSAQVNSGEMILNKSQQANLFKMANGEGQGRQVEFHISGTDLVGVLNNNTRKSRITR